MKTKNSTQVSRVLGWNLPATAFVALLLAGSQSWAQTPPQFIIESRTGGQNFAWFSTTPETWSASSSKSAAPGLTAGIGSRFFTWPGGVTTGIQPTIVLSPQGLVDGGAYLLEIAHITGASLGTNLLIHISAQGATLSTNKTHVFNGYAGGNTWTNTVSFTNNPGVTTPVITFAYLTNEPSGYLGTNQSAGRWYADGFRFTYSSAPCLLTPQIAAVDGPLAAGQVFVNVPGVVAGATNVTVYTTDGLTWTKIGEKTSGVTAGLNMVPTSPLVKGTIVVATQWRNGNESCQPTTGREVGGGANPAIRLVYNIREDENAAGPVGANGGTGGDTFFLGSSARLGGFGSAPTEGITLTPSANWQAVTLTRGLDPMFPTDPIFVWTVTGNAELNGNFGIFDGLGFAISDLSDTGPFQVYIGKVINGGTVIQDFSAGTNGEPTVMFSLPSASGFTADKILPSPDYSVVVTTNAGASGKSLAVGWQFNSRVDATWMQLWTRGTGTPNPLVDLRQPITVELLILPVGQATGTAPIDVTTITNQGVWVGDNAQLSVTAVGTGLSYQWYQGTPAVGAPIPDATSSSYTLNSFHNGMNGLYTVVVTDGVRTNTRSTVLYAVDPVPTITNQPVTVIATLGSTANLMSVGADGHAPSGYPLTYQWRKTGADVPGQTGSALAFPGGVTLADAGGYDVVVANSYGSATSTVAYLSVVSTPAGTGTGLLGQYWTTRGATNAFLGTPTLQRTDATVNFSWGAGSPDPAISANYFTARWAGQVQAVGDDTYTFYTVSDDGVRLWVNGQKLIDQWVNHAAWTNSGTIALTGTTKYDIVMEFYENAGDAVAKLWWSTAGGSIIQSPVPVSQLYPATPGGTPTAPAITYTASGTDLTLTWAGGSATLLSADKVEGPYTPVGTVVSPYTITIGAEPAKFFRLQVQ